MRNLLAYLAAAVLVLAGVGWYLDWFNFRAVETAPGKKQLNIDIHTDKIQTDLQKGSDYLIEEGGGRLQQAIEKRRRDHDGDGTEQAEPAPQPPRR
jgi:hypothetical protein